MLESGENRVAQAEGVLLELKKLGIEQDEMTRLRQDLLAAKPGDVLQNEKYDITVDEKGFNLETKV